MTNRKIVLPLSLILGLIFSFSIQSKVQADDLGKIQSDQRELLLQKEKRDEPGSPSATAPTVISTPKQKLDASLEAVQIHEHDPSIEPDIVKSSEVKRPTVAVALGGGGARGAAHIGVLRVLAKHNIPIDYIVGNSMGSIVGGLYSAGVSLDEIQEMLYDKSLRKAYFPGAIPPKLILSPLLKVTHPFGSKTYAGLWTGDKFKKYLNAHLPKPDMDITETKIPFSAVATNLIDGNAYRISEGPLARAIVASAAISPIIKPVPIDDKIYVDGGVRANLPASSAKETGADVVIAVLVDEPLKDLPAKKFKHLAGIASRLADIILAVADERQLEFADVVINPDVTGVPVLSNRSKDVLIAEKAGEAAAEKAMPAILKKLRESKHNERVAKGGQVHGSAH